MVPSFYQTVDAGIISLIIDIGNEWVPYVGVGIDYANSDPEMGESSDAAEIVGAIGVKYFLTDTLAIDASFNAKQASDDIYPDDDDMNDVTWNITLGLRYLIP
jgi:opacity protein-like surface antigen